MKRKRETRVKVIHKAPGKKGKQECRMFKTPEDAFAYLKRNEGKRLKAK